MTTAAAAAAMTNWIKKSLCLNRISKEIRIRTEIKSIYDETTCSFNMHLIKKEINRQKAAADELRLQFVCDKSFVVQQIYKIYSVICTHDLSVFTQQSYLNRTVCSAFRTVYAVFFDLIFFLCVYQERSFFFFFFFFLIDLKEITICNINMNLMKQWEFNSDDKANAATTARKEI